MDAKSSLTRVRKNISSGQRAGFVAPVETSVARHARITRRATYTGERYIESIVELTLILLCVRSTIAGSASSNRDGVLVHRVLKNTTTTKRQLNLAARMMLEHVSLFSNGQNKPSTMLQLHRDCLDRAAESTAAFVSIQERPMDSEDNQTLILRVVGPIADDGVWAIVDEGCNSCCHGDVWRQNAEVKMKVLGLHPIGLHRKATTFNDVETNTTNTTNQKPTIPMGIALCAVSLFQSRVQLFGDLLSLAQSMQTCFPHIFSFPGRWSWLAMDVSNTSSTLCRYLMICCLWLSQCKLASLRFFPFPVDGLGCQWMSRTPRPHCAVI